MNTTISPADPLNAQPSVPSMPSIPASSVISVLPPPSPHPYSSLATFTPGQLTHIYNWLQTSTYKQTSQLIQQHFQQKITESALLRFYHSTHPIRQHLDTLDQSPAASAAAVEILQLAASNNHDLTQATLGLLEQLTFKLALTCTRQPSDFLLLNRITRIINRGRNAASRARLINVREKNASLRAQELDLKRHLATARTLRRTLPGMTGAPPVSSGCSRSEPLKSQFTSSPAEPINDSASKSESNCQNRHAR